MRYNQQSNPVLDELASAKSIQALQTEVTALRIEIQALLQLNPNLDG